MECKILNRAYATQEKQDVPRLGIRSLCVSKEMWESFKVPSIEQMIFFDMNIRYHNMEGVSIHDSYENVTTRLSKYCTCGKLAAVVLNGVDMKTVENINIYTQCPLLKLTCIKKVVSQMSLPDPMVCNEFFKFYKNKYHDKFLKAAEKFLYITPFALMCGIATLKKQLEILPYYRTKAGENKLWQLDQLCNHYKTHNKIEIQSVGDKVRQICNPETGDKFVGLLMEKSLTAMMYDVFGPRYGVGLSNVEKAKEIQLQLKNRQYVTLDVSGFDNSHNQYFRQPWDYLISEIAEKYPHRLDKYIYPHIVKQQMSKEKSLAEYYIKIGNKQVKYCTLNLGPRLASGSTYTTLINTFLMVLAIEFVGYILNDLLTTSSTSGDDSAAMHDEKIKVDELVEAYYRVYGCKGNDFFNNLGIKLKYCIVSKDVEDLVPCSLDTFQCTCGVHMVRHFFKYIRDTFVSEKYPKTMLQLDIPVSHFEQLVYTGEMSWAKGLRFAEAVLAPLNHNIDIQLIASTIAEKYGKRLQKSNKADSIYLSKYFDLKNIDMKDQATAACKILTVLKGEKYVKIRQASYCKNCSDAYDKYLQKKYGINPGLVMGFLEDKGTHFDFYNNELIERDNRYIPSYIINEAKKFYDDRQAKINYQADRTIIKRCYYKNLQYWEDVIMKIDQKYLQIEPSDISNRKDFLTNKYMEIYDKENRFELLFQEQALLRMYYDVQPDEEFKLPVTKEEIFDGKNTYRLMKIQGKTLKLREPMFQINRGPKPRKNNRKMEKTFKQEYGTLSDKEQLQQFLEDSLSKVKQYKNKAAMIRNLDLPKIDISDAKEIIDFRKYYITTYRFYVETRKEEYFEQAKYCYNKIKELAGIEPLLDCDRIIDH
jgi:hypothetical protein